MGRAVDIVLVGGATVGGGEPFAISPWLAEVEVSDGGGAQGHRGGSWRTGVHFLCLSQGQT